MAFVNAVPSSNGSGRTSHKSVSTPGDFVLFELILNLCTYHITNSWVSIQLINVLLSYASNKSSFGKT